MPLYPPVAPAALVAPTYNTAVAAAVWPAINRAIFMRFPLYVPNPLRYALWVVGVQSGNVQLGVVQLSGTDRTNYTRVMNTGIIACPAAGNIRTDLGTTVLPAGDYAMFMWADNVTFQARYSTASGHQALRQMGSASSLATGVLGTGTLTWDVGLVNMSLEGDV